jgi:hypothetical protein
MKIAKLLQCAVCCAGLISGVAAAAAPSAMVVDNNTLFWTNAYIHDAASPSALGPKSNESIPWTAVTSLCHGTQPPLMQGSDSCAFDVYATTDSANPKQIHVATVTMYLSDGQVVNVAQHALQYGLKVMPVFPGHFELDNV